MDVIAAVATANLPSAIGVIRLSGEGCGEVLARVFRPFGAPMAERPPRTLCYGEVTDAEGALLDRALAVRFEKGSGYTGEESAELYCHGAPLVLRLALEALFCAGARQAEAGEFTRRAFLNGRMDLTEAEAVGDLLGAESAAAAKNAAAQLSGALRRRVDRIYDALMNVASRFYAVVDYPDEDIADLSREEIGGALRFAEAELRALLGSFRRGRVLKNGAATAIIGRPNAGKSSLLNALVGYDRAIVTDIEGTTRDTVEEKAEVGGVLLRLIDTAGIRESGDTVERLGIERSRAAAESADLILALTDGSVPLTEEDRAVLTLASESGRPWIWLRSKCDLGKAAQPFDLAALANAPSFVIDCSIESGEGFDALENAVSSLFPLGGADCGSILTNERQADAAERAMSAVLGAKAAYDALLMPDAILTDIEGALSALGELTGKALKEDLVATIFSKFCVGK